MPDTWWATNAGTGAKDGTSLADAAVVDPADANDVWGKGYAAGDTIKLCGDASITQTIDLTTDGGAATLVFILGRNAGDTADAEVDIDAGGGAFSVFTFTTADYHVFNLIHAMNTDENAGSDGFDLGVDADFCQFYNCRASGVYRGWDCAAGSQWHQLWNCIVHDNAHAGFYGTSYVYGHRLYGCTAYDNAHNGFYGILVASSCVAYDNGWSGFYGVPTVIGCVSQGHNRGFVLTAGNCLAIDCIAAENDSDGYQCDAAWTHLLRCADYNNVSGRFLGTNYTDIDPITCSAAPFLDAANGDFRLNNVAGGGRDLRHIAREVSGQDSYVDIGAIQSKPVRRHYPAVSKY